MVAVLGSGDEFLRVVERAFPATDIHVRGNEITVTGEPGDVALVDRLYDEIVTVLRSGQGLTSEAVERLVSMLRTETGERPADVLTLNILSNRGRTIRPKTLNQKRYVDAIDKHTIVFSIGPAGTGKTYLAMAKAVQALQAKQVNRIILTRPAVEAGERLGFLPGTLYEKIDPYLRPLYDALHDMIDPESIPRLMTAGTIEVAPLAYMRGRAQPLDTPVLTPDGFRPIGELRGRRPGRRLGRLADAGPRRLPAGTQGGLPGRHPGRCRPRSRCAEHLWFVDDAGTIGANGRAGRVVETQDMIGKLRHAHYRHFELPVVRAGASSPEPTYPWTRTRSACSSATAASPATTTPSFATADPELAAALEAALPTSR